MHFHLEAEKRATDAVSLAISSHSSWFSTTFHLPHHTISSFSNTEQFLLAPLMPSDHSQNLYHCIFKNGEK